MCYVFFLAIRSEQNFTNKRVGKLTDLDRFQLTARQIKYGLIFRLHRGHVGSMIRISMSAWAHAKQIRGKPSSNLKPFRDLTILVAFFCLQEMARKKWKREGIVLVTCAIMSNVTLAVGPSVSCCRVAPSFFPSLSSFPCPQRVRSFHDNGKIWENVRDWKNNKAETI